MKFLRAVAVAAAACLAATAAPAQQLRFDDVVRNLRNPDPKARLESVRLLREAKYPEAISAMAPLVLDPVKEVQLETIDAEVSFFIDQDLKARRMVGFVIEKRNPMVAETAFDLGPLALVPRATPPELVTDLLRAVDDANPQVRLEAIYAAGVVARSPLTADQTTQLFKALDHFDPDVRAAAARVIGRLQLKEAGEPLLRAVDDSHAEVRYAAMLALGAIRETRATAALAKQFAYYGKGEGAWSSLEALALIGSPVSTPLFKAQVSGKDPYLRRAAVEGLGRAGDTSDIDTIQGLATNDDSAMVRVAASFAMQKLGRDYVARIVDQMNDLKVVAQAEEYLVELGPSIVPTLTARLQDPDVNVRASVADVLGVIGNDGTVPALKAASGDRNATVAAAARRAIEKIQFRR